MSTILKTLKKLEEGKRLLEKDLDLKELVLQEDQKPLSRKTLEINHKKLVALGLVLSGVIIGLALVWGFRPSVENEVVHFLRDSQKPLPVEKIHSRPTIGIPLANIPERRPSYEETVVENLPPPVETPPVKETSPVFEVRETVEGPPVLPREINEIRDLIQTAKIASEQTEPFNYPPESAARGISIPHLKVKGIIFFSSGSPSNYIFVSTRESKNRKVRVGDMVQSATLMHIESNRVVFSYRGENVHLRIGE